MLFEQDILLSVNKTLLQSLIIAQDLERDELGRELHNNVNQLLAASYLQLQMAKKESDNSPLLEGGLQSLNLAIKEIRKITQSLNTAVVEDLGLETAIGGLIAARHEHVHIDCCFDFDDGLETSLSPGLKLMVYRVIQEQLENVYRHADASCMSIVLQKAGDSLRLSISDDGRGFNINDSRKGMGFIVINSRVASFNGSFRLRSAPGEGCHLEVKVPLL